MQVPARHSATRGSHGSRVAMLGYTVAWLVAAAVIVGVVLAVLGGDDPQHVSLPPVHETELVRAARSAGCELRRADAGEQLNPPVVGGAGAAPAPAGFYDDPLDQSSLLAAMREGVIVIQFRDLTSSDLDLLRSFQEAVPDGTIVTPNDSAMPFVVAITAYRRLLGCRTLNQFSVDAIQLFRGRFVGSGPDA